jgi:hypothetical protein
MATYFQTPSVVPLLCTLFDISLSGQLLGTTDDRNSITFAQINLELVAAGLFLD